MGEPLPQQKEIHYFLIAVCFHHYLWENGTTRTPDRLIIFLELTDRRKCGGVVGGQRRVQIVRGAIAGRLQAAFWGYQSWLGIVYILSFLFNNQLLQSFKTAFVVVFKVLGREKTQAMLISNPQ